MKRKKLLQNEPVWIQTKESATANQIVCADVIAASQIVCADEEEAVEIDLFYRGELRCRYFADRKAYWAWISGKWHSYRLSNAVRVCKGLDALTGIWIYEGKFEWYSKDDKERAEGFFGTSIDRNEDQINHEKMMRAVRRRQERIDREMGQVPAVPEEAQEWAETSLFPENYLFIDRRGSRTDYICTACGYKSWKKKQYKHREKTVCPKCGAPVVVELKREHIEQTKSLVILQTYDRMKPGTWLSEKVWIERQFKAHCVWSCTRIEKKEISLYEEIRVIIPKGENIGEKVYYGTKSLEDEFGQEFWDKNPYNKQFTKAWLYPGNLKEVLSVADLEHSGLIEMAAAGKKFYVNRYILHAKEWPWMEYLVKAGLTDLAEEILDKNWWDPSICINIHAGTLKDVLKLDGNRASRMKRIRGNINTLEWLQYEQRREQEGSRIKISQESLEYLAKVSRGNCEEILEAIGSVNRMVNYMKKQKVSPNNLTTTWHDYLRMAEQEGMDITDDIIRLPKNLKARHDQLAEQINQRNAKEAARRQAEKNRAIDEQIRKHLNEAARYYYRDDHYLMIPAEKCAQLITEGQMLHHCVAASDRYMKKMANGETWILFLRKAEEPEKPYYTVEIDMKDDRILQWYSEFDRKPEREKIGRFLDKYKRKIRQKRATAC